MRVEGQVRCEGGGAGIDVRVEGVRCEGGGVG